MEDKRDKIKEIFLALSFVSFVSSTLVGCMALGYFAGTWLDGWLGFYPYGRMGGLIFGMCLAIWTVARHIKTKFIDNKKTEKDKNNDLRL